MAGSGAAPANSGNCTNPYYPFKVGSKIVYKTTHGTTNSNYTMEVQPADNADTHKLVYTFTVRGQSFPITQEFVCDRDGIRAKGMLDLASALGGANFSFETNSVDGPFMPADMSVGTKWETTYNVTLHTTNAAMARMMEGKHQTTHIASEVVGEESITVAAGTYRALKVKMQIDITSEILPNPIRTTTETWFVRNIGMVKSISTSNGQTTTSEATSVSGF